jgi:hypothetical protein
MLQMSADISSFELAFRERVVVADVRPAVRFGNAEVGEQKGGRFGLH